MYRTDIYFLCKTLADLPVYVVFPFIFVTIPYYAIGLNPEAERFFIACGIVILVANVATSFGKKEINFDKNDKLTMFFMSPGYMISCLAGSTQVALAMAAPLIIPLLLFGGFFLQNGAVPIYFDWMRYISWFMYGNEALSINQWVGVRFNDTVCPNGVCTGEQILKNFDFDPVSFDFGNDFKNGKSKSFNLICFYFFRIYFIVTLEVYVD